MRDHVLDRSSPPASFAPPAVSPGREASAPASARAARRRRGLIVAAALLVAGGLGWYGYAWWTVGRFTETTDDAYVGGDVTVIAPEVSGFIAALAVTDNQFVHAGDLLVRLDARDTRAALAKAEAAVAAQRATLANIAASRRLQLALISEADAELAATVAALILTREDVDRYRALSHDQFASLQRFQQAQAASREAIAADLKARAGCEAARLQLDVLDTRTRQTEAALQSALAERETARLNLGYTELRAPVDGAVGNRSAQVGAFASASAQLLSIVPARGLWVDANFKENQLAHLRIGQSVTITADMLPGETIHGRVESLAPATGAQFSVLPAENATGNFTKIVQRVPVRIRLDGDAQRLGLLRPGLSVTASVDEHPAGGVVR